MPLTIVALCLVVIVSLYFYNNPLKHGRWFMIRRFINWFPLGMTYAFLYMGRYNLTVSKNALGTLMSKEDFGLIFAAGTWTYALSFLVNGPLVDRIGGKKGIMIAAVGSAMANIALGVLTYLVATHQLKMKVTLAFSLIYAVNMYFQSYGAVSIIKVKAYWFHVRERGVFGAIFGTLISFGVYFAFDWGKEIVNMTKVHGQANAGWFERLLRRVFAIDVQAVDATWAVFFIPAALMLFWTLLDWWLIKDTPEEANFPHLETHDASTGQMHVELTAMDLLKKVFASPLMLMFDIPFGTTDWDGVERTEHAGETGKAFWRTKNFNNIRVRIVEYTPGYLADHWCQKGHVLLVLEGELHTELADGRTVVLKPGQSYQVADGDLAHRSYTKDGAKLFIVD